MSALPLSPAVFIGQANARIHCDASSEEEKDDKDRRMGLKEIRNGKLRCCNEHMNISTWNIEYLTDVKIVELQRIMVDRVIAILCIQETHLSGVDSFITEEGFLIILSCGPAGECSSSSVGFIVALNTRKSAITFN